MVDPMLTYYIYGMFACFGMSAIVAVALPQRNTLAQILMILGAGIGMAAAIVYGLTANSEAVPIAYGLLRIHALSALFFGCISLGVLLTSFFAIGYLPRYASTFSLRAVNTASALFVSGMCAVVLANSPAAFLISWEVMSVAAYFLVVADRSEESLYAGFLYFVVTQIGFFALLTGFLLLAQGAIFSPWQQVVQSATRLTPTMLATAFMLLFAGFGSKAGLVPLHQWLPYAHPQAPSHSSALLSGVMLIVAFFGFLETARLFPVIHPLWSFVVIVIGLVSAVFGSIHAAVENDAKRLLAWSSVEHMGLLFSAAGVLLMVRVLVPTPVTAALAHSVELFLLLHALNHLLFKTGLFMSIGAIVSETHTHDLDEMGGLARVWPVFSGVVLALSLAAAALPPFGAFFGEWLYVQSLAVGMSGLPAILATGAAVILALVALVAGLALFASVRLFSVLFLGRPRTEHAHDLQQLPFTLTAPPAMCAALSLLTSFAIVPMLMPKTYAWFSPLSIVPNALLNPWHITVAAIAVVLLMFAIARSVRFSMRTTGTWDCGAPLSPRMQYSATGFAAPARFFFRMLLITNKQFSSTSVSPSNPWIVRKQLAWNIQSIWEHWLYHHIGNWMLAGANFVRRLQSGVVQVYLLLVLLTLIATIIFAL